MTAVGQITELLRKHREIFDRAIGELDVEVRAVVETLPWEGTDEEIHDAATAQGIYNDVYDLRAQVNSFFSTWVDE
ncbi:hypothetical protein HPO96_28590 [Kribbella sandramycini]|uniref:Uncharacterized protein n=1 Tax=Kribbella sandramycini TaxID=60450 RepID=A0A7Y4L4J7_9ACTN|nr:hypothetical protein [Kribbella sandramycini]MBB6571565.1 hypothetical protein [Kribbella sandramycini]NOL44212.1 hypothetical protein [Kribbella sandramycini]